jgi:CRP/FNR family transcriptional regulator, cyclic AMP receptor protein
MTEQANPPFDPQVFLSTVNGGRTLATYAKDDVIFSQGETADAVFYIQTGQVKIVVTSEQGKEAVVGIAGPAEFFGEGCLVAQPVRLAMAVAMTEATIMRLEKSVMVRALHDEPIFAETFMAHLLVHNSRVEEDLVDQLFNSSEKRLARALLLLANFGKETKPELVLAKISQQTLADMIGTTRPRVSFYEQI